MNVTELQQQLADSEHLLPSQREFFSRLFFQLAFNDFSKLAIIGDTGSGKSTLALALAEFFSNCQTSNTRVAFLQLSASREPLVVALSKQWFAESLLSETMLINQLNEAVAATDFTLIIDNTEYLTETDYQWLLTLPVRVFIFNHYARHTDLNTGSATVELTLTLPNVTLADSEYLLRHEQLDALSVAKRYADSDNNLHQILKKPLSTTDNTFSAAEKGRHWQVIVVLVVLFIAAISWYWVNDVATTKPIYEAVRLPVPQQINNPIESTQNVDRFHLSAPQDTNILGTQKENTNVLVQPSDEATAAQVESIRVENEPQTTNFVVLPEDTEPKLETPVAVDQVSVPVELSAKQTENSTEHNAAPKIDQADKAVSEATAATDVIDAGAVKLLALPTKQFLVQLTVLSSETAVQRFSRDYPALIFHSYPRYSKDKLQWVVIAGPFEQQNAAKDYIAQLPTALKKAGPFIRRVSTVQQEIKDATQQSAAQEQRIRE